jgi:hypothetical protein
MPTSDLPLGSHPPALDFPHFPTRWQAVVWRNWGLIPTERIARVLHAATETIEAAAADMGLPVPAPDPGYWPVRGYCTIIRKNWHLLPYAQLLELLDWDVARMNFTLKEDDFLWHKLGDLKPATEPVYYTSLSNAQRRQTAALRKVVARYFPSMAANTIPGFHFIEQYKKTVFESASSTDMLTCTCPPDCIRLDDSWRLALPANAGRHIQSFAIRWLQRLSGQWGLHLSIAVKSTPANYKRITLEIAPDPQASRETHSIDVAQDGIRIAAVDEFGLMRGLNFLADEMTRQATPCLPLGARQRRTRFTWRCVYPYYLLYGDPLSDPEFTEPPAGLFEEYARLDINGIWLQGVLYQLAAIPGMAQNDAAREKRLAALRRLADQAGDYGIGVYLYLNEPRCRPLAFFDDHPAWRGEIHPNGLWAGLCTSQPEVREYVRAGAYDVFRNVPNLAGAFLITMSENLSNCWSKSTRNKPPNCQLCRERDPADVVGEINRVLAEGILQANPRAQVVSWTWGWANTFDVTRAARHLAPGTMLMCTSEEAMPLEKGGVKIIVGDYTMSNPGPGQRALKQWEIARTNGLKAAAKVQLNNTWECPAIPWLPAMELVREHFDKLQETPVSGLLLSWTLGGYPSFNLRLAARYYWEETDCCGKHNRLANLVEDEFGADAAPLIRRALRNFSTAFREFPFEVRVVYQGPHNPGPANLLFDTPSGYHSTMVGFPYDALDIWRGSYPAPVFEEQFRKLSVGWRKGLPCLAKAAALPTCRNQEQLAGLERAAWGAWLHFRSAYLQIRFIRLRDTLPALAGPERAIALREIRKILREEIQLARRLHDLAARDSTIGFEATNQYAYSIQDLIEKVLNCKYLLAKM